MALFRRIQTTVLESNIESDVTLWHNNLCRCDLRLECSMEVGKTSLQDRPPRRGGAMRTKLALILVLALVALASSLEAKKKQSRLHPRVVVESTHPDQSDLNSAGRSLFGLAAAGTTWFGADPTGTSVVVGGVWDFDNRGTIVCSSDPNDTTVYLKNGAFAQGWTSEDVWAQKGVYFHAEDFTDPGFACSRGTVNGDYSAWCGRVSPDPAECFLDPPGYGHLWNQWLSRILTLADSNNTLTYTYRNDTEPGYDYTVVVIDTLVSTQECGYLFGEDFASSLPDESPDTLRCYNGNLTPVSDATEVIDLSDPSGWCDNKLAVPGLYDGKEVRISFVVLSDGEWDDVDGGYATCDGAFAVDDIVVSTAAGPDTTDFETGTLEDWIACPGASKGLGDFAAVRDITSFGNRDPCCFDNTDISGCVLTFFDPDIPGQYGSGGHARTIFYKRAWSPTIDLSQIPDGAGFVGMFDAYLDLPISQYIFYRFHAKYVSDPGCPAGTWSSPVSDMYVYYGPVPKCGVKYRDFSGIVPNDADSLKFGLSCWSGCGWDWICLEGNETPIFDNVRVGVYYEGPSGPNVPGVSVADVGNFCDAFPEDGTLDSASTARIDIANNLGGVHFLNLGDTLVAQCADEGVGVELCFKVIPGPGTDLSDPFFTSWFPGTYAACDTSAGVNPFHYARMDTAFRAGNGVDPVTQSIALGKYASVFHEDDPNFGGAEGVEIFPDSLFTAGTKIYYYIRGSYLGSGEYATVPSGATEADLGSLFEVEILPDQCKDPLTCLIYFDYFNRGAQAPIENALRDLGRTWDRYDLRAEGSFEGNGIGNRFLGPGKYAIRGHIGPSLTQLDHYKVILINNGTLGEYSTFSDGHRGMSDPTDDIAAMQAYLTEGPSRGLWLSGRDIATDFQHNGYKRPFMEDYLGAVWDHNSYSAYSGHGMQERCRDLFTGYGACATDNYFSVADSVGLYGSGCPTRYDYDVIHKNVAADGLVGNALLYDRTDLPGESQGGVAYASVYHIFPTGQGSDSARTVIDGFSLHLLKDERCWTGKGIKDWMRDLLGNPGPSGVEAPGFFALRPSGELLCPPVGEELVGAGDPPPVRYSYRLSQNYPNPFRARTTIRFSTKKKEMVEILVFDAAGRLVKRLNKVAGPGEGGIVWDGTESNGRAVASGIYFYKIRAGNFVSAKRMILVK